MVTNRPSDNPRPEHRSERAAATDATGGGSRDGTDPDTDAATQPGGQLALLARRHDQPTFSGDPRVYALAATPRSGSSLLSSLLLSTGRMGVPVEYFHPRAAMPLLGRRFACIRPAGLDLPAYVAALHRHRTTPNGVFGVKIHFTQLERVMRAPAVSGLLRRARFVWMRRRDPVAQAVSHAIALETKVWSELRDAPAAPSGVRFSADRFRSVLSTQLLGEVGWSTFFRANGIAPLEVWYEDLVADPDWTVRAVMQLMGTAPDRTITLDDAPIRRQRGADSEAWYSAVQRAHMLAPAPRDG